MKQILFFATKNDLIPAIEAVEAASQLKYVRSGNSFSPNPNVIPSGIEISNIGQADAGTASGCASYLVFKRDASINVRRIISGGRVARFALDQLLNPDSVVFTPAGVWNNDVLLHGRVATMSGTPPAQELMRLFYKVLRKQFTKVQAFYVGPEALTWLQAGRRLTISDQSPREFDLMPTI